MKQSHTSRNYAKAFFAFVTVMRNSMSTNITAYFSGIRVSRDWVHALGRANLASIIAVPPLSHYIFDSIVWKKRKISA